MKLFISSLKPYLSPLLFLCPAIGLACLAARLHPNEPFFVGIFCTILGFGISKIHQFAVQMLPVLKDTKTMVFILSGEGLTWLNKLGQRTKGGSETVINQAFETYATFRQITEDGGEIYVYKGGEERGFEPDPEGTWFARFKVVEGEKS